MSFSTLRRSAAVASALLVALPAWAGIRGDWLASAPAAYRAECGSCHIPFPPQMLTANAWQQVMNQLDHHYGDNAELPSATKQAITEFLVRWAGAEAKVGGAPGSPPRLTQTPYFVKKHRKVPSAVWQRADVGSPINCAACHREATAGIFDDHGITLPGGEKWREKE
ncbi:hypothetical protein JCM16106_07630 [Hydrogenophilus islandicus]